MRTVFLFLVVLQFIALVACIGAAASFWMDGAAVVAQARHGGVLARPLPRAPLTPLEHTIALDQFAQTWGARAFPCRTAALLWRDVSDPDWAPPAMPASQRLATAIMGARRATSIRWQIRRLIVACQLERDYDDAQMLRAWLPTAEFGDNMTGAEAAAQAVFQKPAASLAPDEAARLAALLHQPSLHNQPERWAEQARAIELRVAELSR
ncbi:MAG TPA: transglycosylase domain-containing protein [Caulobacterales bacterium]|nr:transglycosylase domain-containing protein [Caulobacterales bacterium]